MFALFSHNFVSWFVDLFVYCMIWIDMVCLYAVFTVGNLPKTRGCTSAREQVTNGRDSQVSWSPQSLDRRWPCSGACWSLGRFPGPRMVKICQDRIRRVEWLENFFGSVKQHLELRSSRVEARLDCAEN